MRKLAPAFVMTTLIALASGSALALGDMHKDKKAPKTDTTTSSTYSSPSAAPANANDKQVARNDADKCDMSKYPNKADMPKDCKDKGSTGAASVKDTQKQSGGDSGSSSGSAGAGSSSSSSGSSSK